MRAGIVLRLIAVATLALMLAGCGGADEADEKKETAAENTPAAATAAAAVTTAPTPAGPQILEIKTGDYFYEPKDITVRPGAVAIKLNNEGPERRHTFNIKNKGGDGDLVTSERIEVGQSLTVEFTITEEGTYETYCSLPGHADRGHTGTLTVKRS